MKNTIFKQSKHKSILNPLPVILFFALVFIGFAGNSQSSVTNGEEYTVYKFSVNGVTNPTEAAPIMTLLMEQSFSSSCTFIDDADCFKLSSELNNLTYNALYTALKNEGFNLSTEIATSDGRSLHQTIIDHK